MKSEILKILGYLVAAGGGGAVIAWAIFSKLGNEWLAQAFSKRLEAFKHEQAKEIEQLRHRITSLFSRISKIHEKEFEVLPAAWLKLHQAYGRIAEINFALKRFPNLKEMSSSHFEEFVAACTLPEFRKKELLEASDRDAYYRRWIWWTELAEAKTARTEFHNYLVMNSLFMTEALRQQFAELDQLLGSVLISTEIGHEAQNPELNKQISADLAKIEPLMSPLEAAVKERLRYQDA